MMNKSVFVLFWIFCPIVWGFGEIATWHPKEISPAENGHQNWTIMKDKYGKPRVVLLEEKKNLPIQLLEQYSTTDDSVRYFLYTRQNPLNEQELVIGDVVGLKNSYWNASKPLKVCIHGFIASYTEANQQKLKSRILDYDDVNVVMVDWSQLADSVFYPTAVVNSATAGFQIGNFIDFLIESKAINPKDVHLIGHSLGAHVAGFAGGTVNNGPIGRISGLDPALPGFTEKGPDERLDANDAEFVDCIHTCGGFLGFIIPICTADFYPNGGTTVQPGCHWYDFGACSHARSHDLFIESIISNHEFPSFLCPNIATDSSVECQNVGALMGYPADPKFKGIFFLKTNSEFPFGKVIDG